MGAEEEVLVTLSGGAPWGFRLQGGAEQWKPLQVSKVREPILRFQGKGNPRELGKSHMMAYRGEVGGCEEVEWEWAGGRGSMLKSDGVAGIVSEQWLLVGGYRKGNTWFLGAEKKKASGSVPCGTVGAEAQS